MDRFPDGFVLPLMFCEDINQSRNAGQYVWNQTDLQSLKTYSLCCQILWETEQLGTQASDTSLKRPA